MSLRGVTVGDLGHGPGLLGAQRYPKKSKDGRSKVTISKGTKASMMKVFFEMRFL